MRSAVVSLLAAAAGASATCADGVFEFTPDLIPLQENAGTDKLFPMGDCFGFKLEEATIDDMQKAMENGMLTSVKLVTCYMTRTFQTQQYINSVMQINPDALAIAAQLDEERQQGNVRGPLHGIPFTVKDNIGTDDNLETTAGSWALLGSRVPRDAHVVAKLRKAGAVLFGKATLSEWADMRSNNYSEGYSGRGRQCRSAYNLTVNPGGSSSGSGVGVGANCIAFSLGTETDGSVINPAMRNSIVGFKPTVGLTSRSGVIPETEHQDSVGTFGRTVRDAVYAFDAIYGVDCRDNYTHLRRGERLPREAMPIPHHQRNPQERHLWYSLEELLGTCQCRAPAYLGVSRQAHRGCWRHHHQQHRNYKLRNHCLPRRVELGLRHHAWLPQRVRVHLRQGRLL
ncbi:hypothetical protein J3459_008530 [Metarhizium acridum]|nr:hypothetical protein J3459_008530 [Metarhizium acridum]